MVLMPNRLQVYAALHEARIDFETKNDRGEAVVSVAASSSMVERFTVATTGRGLHEITAAVREAVGRVGIEEGLCTVFVRHTSASLLVQENADPSAKHDLERWLDRLVPDGDPFYRHDAEGPDDMPATSRPRSLHSPFPFRSAGASSRSAHGRASTCGSIAGAARPAKWYCTSGRKPYNACLLMLRSTKIVATLGPASSDPAVLERMVRAGVDVVRLNFSHGTAEDHLKRAELVRDVGRRTGRTVAIMCDLQGPKIRVGKFKDGKVMLEKGATFILDAECEMGDQTRVGLDYKELPRDVEAGAVLLLDDGKIVLDVTAVRGEEVHTKVRHGGVLSNNKGINRQGGGLTAPALTAKDMEDIRTAVKIQADYLAVSFPKTGADMYMARELMRAAGGKAFLIAKIERAEAVGEAALIDIMRGSDGIMVARGDLAVEVGDASVPALQKKMIRLAREQQQAHDHRDADDGVDDLQPGADARRGVRRRQRGARRHRRGDALGGVRERPLSGRGDRGDGSDLHRGRADPAAQPGAGLPQPRVHARRPVDRDGGALHRLPPQGQVHRRAHRVGLDRAVDEPPQLRRADLRPHLADRHALQAARCFATSRRSWSSTSATTARSCCARPRRCWSRTRS